MPTLNLTSIKQALFPTDYSILDKVPRIHYNTFASTLRSAGSPAYPEASQCWAALRKYGVDPALALAQFQHESSYGTAGRAIVNKSWGNIKRGTFVVYKDWASGAEDYAALVSGYLYAGNPNYNTARKMPYRYAPSADGNNPAEYGAALVKSIGLLIKQDKINNPPATIPTTGGSVSTDRATTLADAIKTRVQYIQNRINSGDLDPRSYVGDIAALNTYVDELHALANVSPEGTAVATNTTPPADTATPTNTTPPVTVTPDPTKPIYTSFNTGHLYLTNFNDVEGVPAYTGPFPVYSGTGDPNLLPANILSAINRETNDQQIQSGENRAGWFEYQLARAFVCNANIIVNDPLIASRMSPSQYKNEVIYGGHGMPILDTMANDLVEISTALNSLSLTQLP